MGGKAEGGGLFAGAGGWCGSDRHRERSAAIHRDRKAGPWAAMDCHRPSGLAMTGDGRGGAD